MDILPSQKGLEDFIRKLPQIVPKSWCLQCKICCRFPASEGVQTPTWSSLEAQWLGQRNQQSWLEATPSSPSLSPQLRRCGEGYRCPAFEVQENGCSIYSDRPLDCRLYPFVLTKDASQTRVFLSMDMKCPYLQSHGSDPETAAYAQTLAHYLEQPLGLHYVNQNPHIVGPSWPEFITVAALPSLTTSQGKEETAPPHPELKPFRWSDASRLKEALGLIPHSYSGYTLAGILGWSDLIRLWWAPLHGNLCLFAEQAGGLFMPLPPLGKNAAEETLKAAWEILRTANQGFDVSRIEGIESGGVQSFETAGFVLQPSEPEYLYHQADLVALRGNRYRSQRWAINRCKREISSFTVRPFTKEDIVSCLQLYTLWGIRRQQASTDFLSKALIRDNLFFHRRLMMNANELGVTGRVLEAEGHIRGYTFGGEITPETFCVFTEITDRSIPGLSNLLFLEYCRELSSYALINTMGDCGLLGLKRSKISYRPIRSVATFTAK